MGTQRRFWGMVVSRAWRDFRDYLRESAHHLMGELVLIAVTYFVLAYAPGLGELRDRLTDAALVMLSIPVAAVLQFFIHLFAAPARVNADAERRIEALEVVLGRDADHNAIRGELESAYWDGLKFYETETDLEVWRGGWPQKWMRRVEDIVGRNFPSNLVFMLKTISYDPGMSGYKLAPITNPNTDTTDLTPVFRAMRCYFYQIESIMQYDLKAALYKEVEKS